MADENERTFNNETTEISYFGGSKDSLISKCRSFQLVESMKKHISTREKRDDEEVIAVALARMDDFYDILPHQLYSEENSTKEIEEMVDEINSKMEHLSKSISQIASTIADKMRSSYVWLDPSFHQKLKEILTGIQSIVEETLQIGGNMQILDEAGQIKSRLVPPKSLL